MRIEDQIKEKLTEKFQPIELIVENESALHKGHAGDDGSGQTHFNVTIIANHFDALSRLERQRAVLLCLKPLFDIGLHALSIKAIPPAEQ